MTTMQPMRMEQGESRVETFTVLDAAGEPFPLSGCNVWFTVRRRTDTNDAEPLIAKNIVNDVADGIAILDQTAHPGQFTVTIEPADTLTLAPGRHVFDAWIEDAAENYRPLGEPSIFELVQPVTRSF